MYEGNGVTKEFPLPSGVDGSFVGLSPPGGGVVKLKEGDGYTVQNGAVSFFAPPPQGSQVVFEATRSVPQGVCTVLYPDGTMKEVPQDPWELLEAARRELDEARRERAALTELLQKEGAAVKALAAEAKETLKARLLNYDARAESAIAAAVEATRENTQTAVTGVMEEIRQKHRQVMAVQADVHGALERTEAAARNGATEAAAEVRANLERICGEVIEAWESVRAIQPVLEDLEQRARNAARTAAQDVTTTVVGRAEVILEELKGLRGRLERDLEQESMRARHHRESEVKVMESLRDQANRGARRSDEIEGSCREILGNILGAEARIREFAERVAAFENTWNARIVQEMEARRMERIERKEAKLYG